RAIFRERVFLAPDDGPALVSRQGPEAIEILGRTLGTYFVPQGSRVVSAKFFDGDLLVVDAARIEDGGLDLVVDRRHVEILWKMLAEKGARPVGQAALNVARVEAGKPWYGDDYDATMLAPEARLDALIAENKGCYTGQEVIARIKNRGHVNRLLVRFSIDGDTVPDRGDLVLYDGEVGWITSPVWSFDRQAPLALGYLRREKAESGTRLRIAHGNALLEAAVI
ncbi:MAG: hypothetical protein M1482_12700, partial [Chloroflexi bacterium]|nr:hypothetical protein [Chloroflexota bacterium]